MTKNDITDYYSLRNITSDYYANYKLPIYLSNILPKNKSINILDIGCGLGQTLSALSKHGYTNLEGIDISSYAVENCRKIGLDVSLCSNIISFCRKRKKKYDFIIMSHVLEHVAKHEIIDTLKTIRSKILSDDGLLCIMVPNAQSNTGSYWAYEDFTHTVLFTSGSLLYVLKAAGFKNVKFLDIDGLEGTNKYLKILKSLLLKVYKLNKRLWNKITSSAYHNPSPQIHTYEIKALVRR